MKKNVDRKLISGFTGKPTELCLSKISPNLGSASLDFSSLHFPNFFVAATGESPELMAQERLS